MQGWRAGETAKSWRQCSISPPHSLGCNCVVNGSTSGKTAENTDIAFTEKFLTSLC